MRRIVFSIAHFLIAATALFFFRLTKLRRTFYVQVECLCFHTGCPISGHSLASTATAPMPASDFDYRRESRPAFGASGLSVVMVHPPCVL